MNTLNLRNPHSNELDQIYEMGFDVWSGGSDREEYLESCRNSRKYQGGEWLVIEKEQKLLCSLLVHRFDEGRYGIGSIATVPEKRKKGYASVLITRAIERLEKEGAISIYLYSDINPKFYEKFGFVALSDEQQKYPDSICMIKTQDLSRLVSEPPKYF